MRANFNQKNNLRRWNITATACYKFKCNCAICDVVPQHLKEICKVKYYVPTLFEKFGEPK